MYRCAACDAPATVECGHASAANDDRPNQVPVEWGGMFGIERINPKGTPIKRVNIASGEDAVPIQYAEV